MLDWIDIQGLARDKAARNEFETLMAAYKNDPDWWKNFFTYDTLNKGFYYLDGLKRTPYVNRQYVTIYFQINTCINMA